MLQQTEPKSLTLFDRGTLFERRRSVSLNILSPAPRRQLKNKNDTIFLAELGQSFVQHVSCNTERYR